MAQETITIAKNQDLRIPWRLLERADFPVGEFKVAIKNQTPAILIIPQIYKQNESALE